MKTFLLLLSTATLAACAAPSQQVPLGGAWPTGYDATLPDGIPISRFPEETEQYFRYSSALQDPVTLVITQQVEWDAAWRSIVANHGPQPVAPTVDFTREMVLITGIGQQPSGGHAVRIERVVENGDVLDVLVTRTSPGRNCGAAAAITSPADIVRAPTSQRPIRWLIRDSLTPC